MNRKRSEMVGHTGRELVDRAHRLMSTGSERAFLGISGPPGSGKSTLATLIADGVNARSPSETPTCVVVPMDGFHLSDAALGALGRLERKGAIDTFDAFGYLAMLRRLVTESDRRVFAPSFHRDLEQPIAAGIMVEPSVRLVVTEGNYLLMDDRPWPQVRELLDEVWYCDLDTRTRVERLVARHVAHGKPPESAVRWVAEVDERNAEVVASRRGHADLVVDMTDIGGSM